MKKMWAIQRGNDLFGPYTKERADQIAAMLGEMREMGDPPVEVVKMQTLTLSQVREEYRRPKPGI